MHSLQTVYGEEQVIDLRQIMHARRQKDRISIWLVGITEEFEFYDQQFSKSVLDDLWHAIKSRDALPEIEKLNPEHGDPPARTRGRRR